MSPAEPKVLTMADVDSLEAHGDGPPYDQLRSTVEALVASNAIARSRTKKIDEQALRIEALTKALGKCLDVMNAEYAMPERGLTDEMRAARKLAEETLR